MFINKFKFLPAWLLLALAACATPPHADNDADAADSADAQYEEIDADVLFHLLGAERLGAADETEDGLQQYLETARQSDDPQHAEEITRLAVSVGAWEIAAAGAERWLELVPDALGPRVFLIRARLELEEAGAAVDELKGLIDAEENAARAWQQAAALLAQAPDEDFALDVMDALLELTGSADSAEALWGQSVLAWRLNDTARALDLGEAAATLSDDLDQLIWTAQLAAGEEQYERSLALYRRAHEKDPGSVEIQLAIADNLRLLERADEAEALLESMPEDSGVLYTLGLYLAEDERLDEAGEVWQRLAALEEVDYATHAYYTGQLAGMIGREADALAWFERVDDGPMRVRAVMQRALLLGEMDESEQARALLKALRDEEGSDVYEQSWLIESQILQDAKRHDEALDVLSGALALLPSSVPLLYSRALVAAALEDIDLAEQDFRSILQVQPDSALALNALGYTLTDRTDRHQEAYRLISRALEQTPDDPAVLDSMGWVYFNLGRPAQALDYLRRALEGEYNPEIAAHLGEVLWELGEREEAVAVLEEAYERYPNDEYLLDTRIRLGLARDQGPGTRDQ